MHRESLLRKKFESLRRRPGPRGWQRAAAKELNYSPGYISRLVSGKVKSPAAEAALAEWKRINKVA